MFGLLVPLLNKIIYGSNYNFRNFHFLLNAFNLTIDIVKTCIQSDMYNSNTCIGYKLGFYHYKYSLDMHDSYTASMQIINGQNLSDYQSSIVNNLSTLMEDLVIILSIGLLYILRYMSHFLYVKYSPKSVASYTRVMPKFLKEIPGYIFHHETLN